MTSDAPLGWATLSYSTFLPRVRTIPISACSTLILSPWPEMTSVNPRPTSRTRKTTIDDRTSLPLPCLLLWDWHENVFAPFTTANKTTKTWLPQFGER